ncbi:hypothetical protein [Lelliottia amnigena]|uniref:hypothetical protein n=1 Tax=Lelliottia amnigena TaxID=61646 RepID=UPI0021D9D5CE|nr:hypothetical protein [Lelliottia amnigena]MCU7786126.1 hypothetical protein [Lelliottia amnigena]
MNPKGNASSICAAFGYYPYAVDTEDQRFSVKTSPSLHQSIVDVNSHPNVVKDWIYPGAKQVHIMANGIKSMPYNTRVFGLPKTHYLQLNGKWSSDGLNFVIWCLSFFMGIRLTTTDAGFLDAASIKPNKLVDFVMSPANTPSIINLSLDFIEDKKNHHAIPRLPAVVHALFLSQYPHAMSFERFQYLYMAIDGCFKILWEGSPRADRQPRHSERIEWMCSELCMPVPFWSTGKEGIASLRNDNFHEAIFFGQPLGFSSFKGANQHDLPTDLIVQMEALVCRLIVAILGVKDQTYITSAIDSREYVPLTLT